MERCDTPVRQDPDDLEDDAGFGDAVFPSGPVPAARLASLLRAGIAADRPAGAAPGGMELAAAVLWSRFLRFDVADPSWADRDRFVLSSGRFLPLLRTLLRLTGHGTVPPGCAFGQHPAVETASGPPGQGFATAVGMAVAERALAGRFGRTLVDHRSWVLACETDLAAGVSLEAAALAGQMQLDKLVVLSAAAVAEGGSGPDATTRFAASGWAVRRVDHVDPDSLTAAIKRAMRSRRPTLIVCQPGDDAGPQGADPEAAAAWAACGQRGAAARRGWLRRLARHRLRAEFERTVSGRLPVDWEQDWRHNQSRLTGHDAQDTARHGLALLCGLLPEMMTLHSQAGASLASALPDPEGLATPPGRAIRHLACGVQEHGMAALTNGLSLHGGARPVVSASVVSIDRMRPALRLAALMGQPVIYLLSDDGLPPDMDGAGWQPIEQLASLRAMPEVAVFRPADPDEMAACWTLALRRDTGPSLVALSSRPVPAGGPNGAPAGGPARGDARDRKARGRPADSKARGDALDGRLRHCARGGYILAGADEPRLATLIATGPEVAVALEARALLRAEGIAVAVVSLPCWELFAAQPASYRADVLGEVPRIGIEAASGFGWERWLGADGIFIGMDGFGAAAPADAQLRQSGITPGAVAARVRRRLGPVLS